MHCLDLLDRVLTRHAAPAGARADLLAALRDARDPARVRDLLLARRPRRAAFLAAFAGHVTVRADAILLTTDPLPPGAVPGPTSAKPGLTGARACHVRGTRQPVYRYGPLRDRRARVTSDARVPALTPLTDGPADLHDVLTIAGDDELTLRLAADLTEAIGRRLDLLELVISPMLSLVAILDPGASDLAVGARMSRAAYERLLARVLRRTLRDVADRLPAALAELLVEAPRDVPDPLAPWHEPAVRDAWADLVERGDLPPFPAWPVVRAAWTGVAELAAHIDPV